MTYKEQQQEMRLARKCKRLGWFSNLFALGGAILFGMGIPLIFLPQFFAPETIIEIELGSSIILSFEPWWLHWICFLSAIILWLFAFIIRFALKQIK